MTAKREPPPTRVRWASWARLATKAAVRSSSQLFFRVTGRDGTRKLATGGCLVLAPHCDDETLGCGATIARKRACDTSVVVVIVADVSLSPTPTLLTDAEYSAMRRAEALVATTRLGVDQKDVHFLGFADGALADQAVGVAAALEALITPLAPEQVFVTSRRERHPDHAALGQVAADLLERGVIDGDLFEYAIWQRVPPVNAVLGIARSLLQGRRHGRRPPWSRLRPQLVRSDGYLTLKHHALEAYPSQLPLFPLGFVEDFLQPIEVFVPVVTVTRKPPEHRHS